MKHKLLENIRCPRCLEKLQVHVFEEEPMDLNGDDPNQDEAIIKTGVLLCSKCMTLYPIANYVPVLLIFFTDFHKGFIKRWQAELNGIGKYAFCSEQPEKGEISVQKTFTEEWRVLKDDELSFYYDFEDLKDLHKEVFLQWDDDMDCEVMNILNVGVGYGTESKAIHEALGGRETMAVDLNFSLLSAGHLFKNYQNLHLIIASLFHLPFSDDSFDLVYCQGVAHHTFSTFAAMEKLKTKTRKQGRLFVWIYAMEDHFNRQGFLGYVTSLRHYVKPIIRHSLNIMPSTIRACLVNVISFFFHPYYKHRERHGNKWKHHNTVHALYDMLTPKYVHRHTFNETIEWFENHFKNYRFHSPAIYRQRFGRSIKGIGITGVSKRPTDFRRA